jgi:mxaC protein
MSFDHPWVLLLLPLAVLPLVAEAGTPVVHSWLRLMPRDAASEALQWVLRGASALAIAALVVGIAGPHRPEYDVERVGTGAEIVLVLDRSRSMDQNFAAGRVTGAPAGTGPEAIERYTRLNQTGARDSKGKVARQMLAEFAAKRSQDRFAMIAFSTLPMRVLDFTQKQEVIQAAITAGNIGRGLSETDIGLALQDALSFFEDRPYTGSRIIMLVSDGGDHMEPDARERITYLARKLRVAVYWIYIRSFRSPGLMADSSEPPSNTDIVPEYFLHRFFQGIGTPYRAYEAENPEALQKAIDDVNRLENLPITYRDTVPRRDLAPWCHAVALACIAVLLAGNLVELRRWA